MKNTMNENIEKNISTSLENNENDLSFISSEEEDISYSYNNMSCIEPFLDVKDNYDLTNENNFKKTPNNLNMQNNNNVYLNNGINNFNFYHLQQIYSLYYYNQCLSLNNKILEYKLLQSIMNNINNKNFNIYYQKKNKKMKNKIEEKQNKIIVKKPPKPENEIKIPLILSGEEKRTLVKLCSIPYKYSPFDMIVLIDKYLNTKKGERIYNSIYVPLTKVIGKNKGYCFINLVSPKYVLKFYEIFNGLNFRLKNCKKECTVVFSDKQIVDCSNKDALKRPIIFTDVINN